MFNNFTRTHKSAGSINDAASFESPIGIANVAWGHAIQIGDLGSLVQFQPTKIYCLCSKKNALIKRDTLSGPLSLNTDHKVIIDSKRKSPSKEKSADTLAHLL